MKTVYANILGRAMRCEVVPAKPHFVRPKKGLPLTFLIVGEGKSMSGDDIWLVKEFGYSKTFGAAKHDVNPLTPSPQIMELLNAWLHMISFAPSPETSALWRRLSL